MDATEGDADGVSSSGPAWHCRCYAARDCKYEEDHRQFGGDLRRGKLLNSASPKDLL
ncbi:hypothetical protein [Streptomyces dysideae]|uniref:hypothetical protein n=1 Tax=Streptomyces dysideae TaxID=909626 RepID=UPI00131A6832|nr:hypothetical protein [Streptomyces dysideae]